MRALGFCDGSLVSALLYFEMNAGTCWQFKLLLCMDEVIIEFIRATVFEGQIWKFSQLNSGISHDALAGGRLLEIEFDGPRQGPENGMDRNVHQWQAVFELSPVNPSEADADQNNHSEEEVRMGFAHTGIFADSVSDVRQFGEIAADLFVVFDEAGIQMNVLFGAVQ